MSIDELMLALSKTMFEHNPGLMRGEVQATAQAALALSDILGGILAGMIMQNPDDAEEAMKIIMDRIGGAMKLTMEKAIALAARGGETLQ